MPFIIKWLQLFAGSNNDRQWNADFVSFVDAYVDRPERLDPLLSRLTNGFWEGSYSNKLETERDQLLQLKQASSNLNVHRWIDQAAMKIENLIPEQRRQEANREASHRA